MVSTSISDQQCMNGLPLYAFKQNFQTVAGYLSSFAVTRCLSSTASFTSQPEALIAFFASDPLDKVCSNVLAYFRQIDFETFINNNVFVSCIKDAPAASKEINRYGISFTACLALPDDKFKYNLSNESHFFDALRGLLVQSSPLTDTQYKLLSAPIFYSDFKSREKSEPGSMDMGSTLMEINSYKNNNSIVMPSVYKELNPVLDSLHKRLQLELKQKGKQNEEGVIANFLNMPAVKANMSKIEEAIYQLAGSPVFYKSSIVGSYMELLRTLKAPKRAISLFDRISSFSFSPIRTGPFKTLIQYMLVYTEYPEILLDSGQYRYIKGLEEHKDFLFPKNQAKLEKLLEKYLRYKEMVDETPIDNLKEENLQRPVT